MKKIKIIIIVLLSTVSLKAQENPFQIINVKLEVVGEDKKLRYVNVQYEIFNNSDSSLLFDNNWVLKEIYSGKKKIRHLEKYKYIVSDKFYPPNNNSSKDDFLEVNIIMPYLNMLLNCNKFDITQQLINEFKAALHEFYVLIEPMSSHIFIENYVFKKCKKNLNPNFIISNDQTLNLIEFKKNGKNVKVKNCHYISSDDFR